METAHFQLRQPANSLEAGMSALKEQEREGGWRSGWRGDNPRPDSSRFASASIVSAPGGIELGFSRCLDFTSSVDAMLTSVTRSKF